ncbi:MAG TPA: hypothetical protein VFV67_18985 [Actinophytocola sp.]|uniref:hypothetical protein n=1 Tax=Actinophytocola sp. TaxID=1872138 RepID=UPI002DBE4A6E|nr:hypothetical protein [Actinophytocola sp.]HEU5472738.1 hypothetical protein [Actinophytocola sp.]
MSSVERLAEYECGRCGRLRRFFDRWPDGYICRPCYIHATRIHGTCAGCGRQRLLPGRDTGGSAICRDCAAVPRSFDCVRCGAEGRLYYRKVCIRCRLHDLAAERLDDGTGTVRPDLQPLVAVLASCYKTPPGSRLAWLNLGRTKQLLAALATGRVAVDHAALDVYPDQRSIPYLRALLVAAGCLPDLDRAMHNFETWLRNRLSKLAGHPHERVLRQFGVWHQLSKMRAKAQQQALSPNARTYAVFEFNRAVEFCTWLAEHDHRLDQLSQPTFDRYYGGLSTAYRQSLRGFLNWAITTKRMPRLQFARPRFRTGEALDQQRRLDLLGHLLDGDDQRLAPRVAGCILLLYAQPIPRILAITLDDIVRTDTGVVLRLGDPPSPVPEPFADLLLRLADQRAQAGGDRWLFSGRSIGQPMSDRGLARRLRDLGIPPASRANRRSPPTRPRGSCARRFARTRLPPHDHPPPKPPRRRHLEPLHHHQDLTNQITRLDDGACCST